MEHTSGSARWPRCAEVGDLLVPLRMLNELAYCPRLFALEWLDGEWAESADTVEGTTAHRLVDRPGGAALPAPGEGSERPKVARSLDLGSERLGLVGRLDLAEAKDGVVTPVETKKGSPPDLPEGAWEPERVQVAAQVMLLREHGYRSDHGVLWFAGARRRVRVEVDAALEQRVIALRDEARQIASKGQLPPPLVDSPKCPRCSLVAICMPDEQNALTAGTAVRPMLPLRDDGVPLYVQMHGGTVGLSQGEVVVRDRARKEVGRARLEETSRVIVYGNATATSPLMRALAERDIPLCLHTYGGWLAGIFTPASGRNVRMRRAQHRTADDPRASLAIAKAFIASKVRNQRVLLRRNGRDVSGRDLAQLQGLRVKTEGSTDAGELLGIEGAAAATYFKNFARMIRGELAGAFEWSGRNRRPPRDPINAMLSFAYACLSRELTHIAHGVGLDPYVGFLHQPRPGRPALALDLMEEFRPVLADSVVITVVNNGVLTPGDFVTRAAGVALTDAGRRRFIQAWERRLDTLATHPTFGTRLSYRRILEVQTRLLAKVLSGDLDAYPGFAIR